MLLAAEPAKTDLADYLDEARSRVRIRVNDSRWQSWELTAVDSLSGKEATVMGNLSPHEKLPRQGSTASVYQ